MTPGAANWEQDLESPGERGLIWDRKASWKVVVPVVRGMPECRSGVNIE